MELGWVSLERGGRAPSWPLCMQMQLGVNPHVQPLDMVEGEGIGIWEPVPPSEHSGGL